MNKSQLIDSMAQKAGISKEQAEAALSAFTDTVVETLQNDEDVSMVGFGSFSAKHRAARQGRNPATGETIQIAAKIAPAFKASKQLKDSLNQASSESSSEMGSDEASESGSEAEGF